MNRGQTSLHPPEGKLRAAVRGSGHNGGYPALNLLRQVSTGASNPMALVTWGEVKERGDRIGGARRMVGGPCTAAEGAETGSSWTREGGETDTTTIGSSFTTTTESWS
jgi:hypothetical protein